MLINILVCVKANENEPIVSLRHCEANDVSVYDLYIYGKGCIGHYLSWRGMEEKLGGPQKKIAGKRGASKCK
jgi:hypothetical protein